MALDTPEPARDAPPAASGPQPSSAQGSGQSLSQRLNRALRPSSGEHTGFGLSAKLLVLTTLFVMLAEILIFFPSVANFRHSWLKDRITAAQIAALAADANPAGTVPDMLQIELLKTAQVRSVALKRNDQRRLVLSDAMPGMVDATYDVREPNPQPHIFARAWTGLVSIKDAMAVFFAAEDRLLRVIGQPNMGVGEYIEIVLPEAPLRRAMIRYGLNVLVLSIIISAMTAALVYLALNALLVRPMTRMTRNMLRFSERPEDARRIIKPSHRGDEIGTAERELSHMQTELSQLLAQKTRLAALGLAVSKINHDLRNLLSTAQLISDRLATTTDPTVQRVAPKLIASLDRAINFCNDTLKFGRAAEAPPRRTVFDVQPLIAEIAEGLGLPTETVGFENRVAPDLMVDADRDHLYRVISNLARNAMQAIEAQDVPSRPMGTISISATRKGQAVELVVADTGPGLPDKAKAHLFEAFQGSQRKGGTGLGLAIARELIQAHGGTLTYVDPAQAGPTTARTGAQFVILLPDRDSEH